MWFEPGLDENLLHQVTVTEETESRAWLESVYILTRTLESQETTLGNISRVDLPREEEGSRELEGGNQTKYTILNVSSQHSEQRESSEELKNVLSWDSKNAFASFCWLPTSCFFLGHSLAGSEMTVLSLGGGGLREGSPLPWKSPFGHRLYQEKDSTYYESIFLLKID